MIALLMIVLTQRVKILVISPLSLISDMHACTIGMHFIRLQLNEVRSSSFALKLYDAAGNLRNLLVLQQARQHILQATRNMADVIDPDLFACTKPQGSLPNYTLAYACKNFIKMYAYCMSCNLALHYFYVLYYHDYCMLRCCRTATSIC